MSQSHTCRCVKKGGNKDDDYRAGSILSRCIHMHPERMGEKGYIPVVMKTPTGYLKFAEEDVEAFRKKMEQDGDILTTGK